MAGKLPAANAQPILEASPAEPSAQPPVSTVSTVSATSVHSATSTSPLLPPVSTVSTVSPMGVEGAKRSARAGSKAGTAGMGLVPIDKINWNLLPASPEQRREQAFTAVDGMATPSPALGADSLKKKSRGNGEMGN